MNAWDFRKAIADNSTLSQADVVKVLNGLEATITTALQAGEVVTIPWIVTIESKPMAARIGRNPQTGLPLEIKAQNKVSFKGVATLKKAVK